MTVYFDQAYVDEVQGKFFREARLQLIEAERCLISLIVRALNTETLNDLLYAIKKIRIDSTACGFLEVTEIAVIFEFLLKIVLNVAIAPAHIDLFFKVNRCLKLQLDSLYFGALVDQALVNKVQMLLNESLSDVVQ